MSTRHVPVPGVPGLHALSTPAVSVVKPEVVVELDGAAGERLRLVFSPYQAVRIRTADLFVPPADGAFRAHVVMEVLDSPWLAELGADLERVASGATFMGQAHHYLLTAGDSVVEVVARGLEWTSEAAG